MKLIGHPITWLFDRFTNQFEISRFLAKAEVDFWCVHAWDKKTREMDTTLSKRDRLDNKNARNGNCDLSSTDTNSVLSSGIWCGDKCSVLNNNNNSLDNSCSHYGCIGSSSCKWLVGYLHASNLHKICSRFKARYEILSRGFYSFRTAKNF